MVKQIIDRGILANDGTGDTLRNGAQKINDNFTEIYNAIGDGTTLNSSLSISDETSTLSNISLGDTITFIGTGGISTALSGNTLTIDASDVESGYTIKNSSSILSRRTYLRFDGTFITATDSSSTDESVITLSSNLQAFSTKTAPQGTIVGTYDNQILTNKTISGSSNTLSNIGNASLTNSTITVQGDTGSNAVDLGDTLSVQGGTGITTSLSGNTLTITGASQAFDTIVLNDNDSTQTTLNSSTTNTLTLTAGNSVTFDVNELTNTIIVSAAEAFSLNYSSSSFTGDGSTSSFTLTSSDRSVEDILVVVNGFIYEPTVDYTITGSTLNITDAPASGAEIRVRYFPLTAPIYPGSVDTQTLSYTSFSLTGDGSTQSFNTSAANVSTPDGISNENVLVIYNGVLLFPIEYYTMGSNNITFTEAPVADAEIEIRFLPNIIRN